MDWKYNYEKEKWELIDMLKIVATLEREDFDYYRYKVGNIKRVEYFNTLFDAKTHVEKLYGGSLDE